MTVGSLYLITLILYSAGALSVFITQADFKQANRVAHGLAALGSLAAALCAIFTMFVSGAVFSVPFSIPFGVMTVRLDLLSAYFLLGLGIVGFAASVYAYSYSRGYYGPGFRSMAALYNILLLSIVLVFTVSHVIGFLIAWELMAVVSFLLVVHESEKRETRTAAFIYMVMTHVGTAFIIIAFLLLSTAAGSFDFSRLAVGWLSETGRTVVFLCALIGFGTKAGVIPVHIWMPRAYPAAPSHAAALISGIMMTTAVYGLCRFFLEFLGTGPVWWGGLILILAAVSSIFGVLYALMENDIKKMLAYSSVENIGIILLGVGAAMVFTAKGQGTLAALAWTAALYHTLNHAVFKSLLFLVAGAIFQATHTKNIEKLGGLIKTMPLTVLCFFVGVASISSLPPLNGFVSEWLTFQSLFFLPQALSGVAGKLTGALLVVVLGLTGALAAACFVKAFGIACLAKPRSKSAAGAGEAPFSMRLSMGFLSLLCLAMGLWPQPILTVLQQTLADFPRMQPLIDTSIWYKIAFESEGAAAVSGIPVILVLLGVCLLAVWFLYRMYGQPQSEAGETWTCGIVPDTRMQYSATGFSKPLRTAFRAVLRPRREILVDASQNRYFGRHLSYRMYITYILSDAMYRPVSQAILRASRFMKKIQAGSVQLYIGYMMAVTVVVLIWSTRW